MPYCVICEESVVRWLPHPERDRRSPFTLLLESAGSDLDHYLCPSCHCHDRERHLWLYLRAAGLVDRLRDLRILHVAPETNIERRIRSIGAVEYVTGDLVPREPQQRKFDVEQLPFADRAFDLVLCNHVLEHVADPDRGLRELARCLERGGHLVAQTPYVPTLKCTFEMTTGVSPHFARLFYGQEDHVRLFGADLLGRFHAAGLRGELRSHRDVLGNLDPLEYGCNEREPFFHFERS